MGRKLSDSPKLQLEFDSFEVKQALMHRAQEEGFSTIKDFLQAIALQRWQEQSEVPEQFSRIAAFIEEMQPFEISYLKATGDIERYQILYAELNHRSGDESSQEGGAWYLEAYCAVPNPNAELQALAHNRTFLLDRLQDAVTIASPGEWRGKLDSIEVTLRLFGRLAHNYRPQAGRDIPEGDTWIDGDTRQVVWRVTNVLWAKRPVLRYGSSCQIITPYAFRKLLTDELEAIISLYSIGDASND